MPNYTAAIDGNNIRVYLAESGVLSYSINVSSAKEMKSLTVTPPIMSLTFVDHGGKTILRVYDINKGMIKYENVIAQAPSKPVMPVKTVPAPTTEEETNSSGRKETGYSGGGGRGSDVGDRGGDIGCAGLIITLLPYIIVFVVCGTFTGSMEKVIPWKLDHYLPWYGVLIAWTIIFFIPLLAYYLLSKILSFLWDWLAKMIGLVIVVYLVFHLQTKVFPAKEHIEHKQEPTHRR